MRTLNVRHVKRHVTPCFNRTHGCFSSLIAFDDCAHVERVGEDQTIEAETFTQDSVNDCVRERRGLQSVCAVVERGHGDVCCHHCAHAASDCGVKWRGLRLVQTF